MKYAVAVILILIFSDMGAAQEKESLSLDQCIREALDNNLDIKSGEFRVGSASERAASSKTAYLPQLHFAGSYSRLSSIDPFAITMTTGERLSIFPNIRDKYSLALQVQQPVFTGFAIESSVKMAEYMSVAQEHSLDETQNNVRYNVEKCFWQVAAAIESDAIIDESIVTLEQHLRDVINFRENGLATENDVKKVQVQLSDMRLMKTTIRKNIRYLKSMLAKLMDRPIDEEFDLSYTLAPPALSFEYEALAAQAAERRPLLRTMSAKVKVSEAGATAARSAFYPSIYLVGSYDYARPNNRIMPQREEWNDTWNAGISIQYTLWNWGKRRHDFEAAEREADLAQTEYVNAVKQNSLSIKSVFLDMEELLERHMLLVEKVELADENYRIAREWFQNGMLLNSELLDAEVNLMNARLDRTKCIVDFNVRTAELNMVAGLYE